MIKKQKKVILRVTSYSVMWWCVLWILQSVSDPNPAIVSPIPTPAKPEPLVLRGIGVTLSHLKSFGVVRSRSHDMQRHAEPIAYDYIFTSDGRFGAHQRLRSRLRLFHSALTAPEPAPLPRLRCPGWFYRLETAVGSGACSGFGTVLPHH